MEAVPPWDEVYRRGAPPWDIGKPQPVFVKLAQDGEIEGEVLDIGCGTGENALMLASLGHRVLGMDLSQRAIEAARAKARGRGLGAEFRVGDALHLESLEETFDSIIDCGLFHTFDDEERPPFVRSLGRALKPGGTYHMMCMSDQEPADWGGPRRVSEGEIRGTFGKGWRINYIRPAVFETRMHDHGAQALLSSMTRRG